MEKPLTIKDMVEYLQMSKEKIYKLAQQGKIPVSMIENQCKFKLEKINVWLEVNKLGTLFIRTEFKPREKVNKTVPFLKWAGGKGQLLKQYEEFFPNEFNNFLEPFVGGGAVCLPLKMRIGQTFTSYWLDTRSIDHPRGALRYVVVQLSWKG